MKLLDRVYTAGLEWHKFYAKFCENRSAGQQVQMQYRQIPID
jgi:hypothetical protein